MRVDENTLLQHADFLRALTRGLLKTDAVAAEDVVQETWLTALERPPKSARNLRGWLGVVARNLALRAHRSAKRRAASEQQARRPDPLRSADEVAARFELQRKIAAAVENLDEPYRSAIHFRYFDDLSPLEIAVRLAVPVKTVKTRLHRALEMLRGRLDRDCGGRKAWSVVLLGLMSPPRAGGAATVAMAGGVSLTMKKATAIVSVLVAATLLVWWGGRELSTTQRTEQDEAKPASAASAPAKRPQDEDLAASPDDILRESDMVPAYTFAGRVVDRDGQGVPLARVRLVYWTALRGDGQSGSSAKLVRRDLEKESVVATPSNDEGYFRFDRPYPSRSYLRVDADEHPTAITGPHRPGKFILVRLERHALVRVRVEDPDGEVVERCRVRLLTKHGARQVFAEETTDASGTVTVPRPPDRNFIVEADPNDPTLGLANRGLNDEIEVVLQVPRVKTFDCRIIDAVSGAPLGDAYVIVCKQYRYGSPTHQRVRRRFHAGRDGIVRVPWQEAYVRFFATAPGYEMSFAVGDPTKLRRSAEVHGVVLDPSGIPAPNVPLLVLVPDGHFERTYFGLPLGAGRTNAEGRFDIEIKVLKPLWGQQPPDPGVRTLVALRGKEAPAILDSIAVQPGTRQRVTLRFPRPATLDIEVVDAAGDPIPQQWIQLARTLPRAPSWSNRSEGSGLDLAGLQNRPSFATDESGRFTVEGLAPGRYTIRVDTTRATKQIREGAHEKLRLQRGVAPGIDVTVRDRDGEPLAGTHVSLSGPAASGKKTDAHGRARFLDLKPGTYKVGIRIDAWNGDFHREAKPGDTVELQIPEGPARLHVVVEGPPVQTAEAYLVTETGGYPYQTFTKLAKDGLTPPFSPGDGILIVRAAGHGMNAIRFHATAAQTTEVHVDLPQAGRVVGSARVLAGSRDYVRLIREDGFPYALAGQSWWLPYSLQRLELGRRPDKVGRFAIEEVPPAVYRASLGHFEDNRTIQSRKWIERKGLRIEVKTGETVAIDLR